MIEGEYGRAILTNVVAHQFDALIDGDSITVSLLGACLADALRKGETPREIAMGLWKSLPSDEEWENGLRDTVVAAIDEYEEEQAA